MGHVMVEVKQLERTYHGKVDTPAVKGVSFTVEEGEFLAIMGKSGSGKSTMLRILGLLDSPTGGTISIDGVDIGTLSDAEKTEFRLNNIGYIFQEYALLPELTALENVCLPLMMHNHLKKELKQQATEMLEKVNLGHRIDHYPEELSGGEQQRVAIARALVNVPKVLFADEPCANLDSITSKSILELLSELNKNLNITILMVTHEPEDKQWVHRVMNLKDGLIENIVGSL
jgi:putative ABC transport system ATP-binding protein